MTKVANHLRCSLNPVAFHRSQGVRIGENVSIYGSKPWTFGGEPYLVTIGDNVTIAQNCEFITHDGGLRVIRDKEPGAHFFAPIVIEDHAFIGAGTRLLAGAVVGRGSVIGASSLVTQEIPPGVVAAGVPAKVIKSVDDYAYVRRDNWTNTTGMSKEEKERVLRAKFAL